MKVLIKSAWGSADPTQAISAFHPRLRRLFEGPGGGLDADLAAKNASSSDPPRFVGLVEWAERILTE